MMNQIQAARQTELVKSWERHCAIPSINHAARVLGLSWVTYSRYRKGSSPLPVVVQYAMHAIARKMPPWGQTV
jgi:hypothetical protein